MKFDDDAKLDTSQIDDQRGSPPKQRGEVERPLLRQLLQGGLRPAGLVEDLAGEGHAELALDLPALAGLFHQGISCRRGGTSGSCARGQAAISAS